MSYLLTYLIIIYHYIPSRISREKMKTHPWTNCSLCSTKAARTVPCCCCAWGHFEYGGAGVALPLCGVNSCPGVPLPFTTHDCCCPLVSTTVMNIFLNFANSITLSLIIIPLVPSQTYAPVSHNLNKNKLRTCTPLIKIFCLLPMKHRGGV